MSKTAKPINPNRKYQNPNLFWDFGQGKVGTDREDHRDFGWNYRTRIGWKYNREKYLEELSCKELMLDLDDETQTSF